MAKANGDDVSIAEFQAYLDKLFGALGRNACAMEEILKMMEEDLKTPVNVSSESTGGITGTKKMELKLLTLPRPSLVCSLPQSSWG